jgi:hypothetical protein
MEQFGANDNSLSKVVLTEQFGANDSSTKKIALRNNIGTEQPGAFTLLAAFSGISIIILRVDPISNPLRPLSNSSLAQGTTSSAI